MIEYLVLVSWVATPIFGQNFLTVKRLGISSQNDYFVIAALIAMLGVAVIGWVTLRSVFFCNRSS